MADSLPFPDRTAGRIVIRGVNWLGDAVMSTPALRRLREARPGAHLTLLTPAKLADLWTHHPDLNAVMPFPPSDGVWRVAGRLKRGRFDLALILPNSPRSALECLLARVPRRVGFGRPWRNWALTDVVPSGDYAVATRKRSESDVRALIADSGRARETFPASAHQVRHYLELVRHLGAGAEPLAPFLAVADEEVRKLCEKFQLGNVEDGAPLIGINPGAEFGPAKRWPGERFVELIRHVNRTLRCRWVIVGGSADCDLAARIAEPFTRAANPGVLGQFPVEVLNLAGKTTLRDLCAAFRLCRCVVTNDTGPMHVAAALGTPVIALFGSTAPELTRPGLPGDTRHRPLVGDAACAPCFRRECPIDFRCMMSIQSHHVAEEVLRVVSGG